MIFAVLLPSRSGTILLLNDSTPLLDRSMFSESQYSELDILVSLVHRDIISTVSIFNILYQTSFLFQPRLEFKVFQNVFGADESGLILRTIRVKDGS